jgi:Domain of unknown function (DUF5753)/Helix-turn-helix domain
MTTTPSVRRRLIGSALRYHRENQGYDLDVAAGVLECHRSKVSRIETGQRSIRPKELRELLTTYKIGEPEYSTLVYLAETVRAKGWWDDFGQLLPATTREYLALENAAFAICLYRSQQVPEPLQIPEYARAVAHADPSIPSASVDLAVLAAEFRHDVILEGPWRRIEVVIGEGALAQQVGDAQVMRDQIAHLATIAVNDSPVSVQVLPFSAGAHPAIDAGAMTTLRFGRAPDIGIVHLPGPDGGACLDDRDVLSRCTTTFAQLQQTALSPQESFQLLERMTG